VIRRWDDLRVLLVLAALLAGLAPAPARAADAVEPADVVYMNRLLYTMRAPVAGASPAQRAERAVQRLRAVPDHQLDQPVTTQGTSLDGEPAVALRLGDTTLITVVARDLDPEAGITLDAVAAASAQQLSAALAARRQMWQPQVLLRGAAVSLLGLPVVLLGAWLARRLLARIDRRLRQVVAEEAASHRILGVDWSEFGFRAIAGTMRLLSWFGVAALAFVWVSHSLRQFPLTRPLADGVRAALAEATGSVGLALWRALPDLLTIVIVVLTARGIVAALDHLFTGIGQGRLRVPGIHPETARATRRLAVFGVWGLTLASVYPYIPGSESAVFRGFSVFLGFMFTLGSTGVVSQWMQGLVLVYSRALRVGDFVRIGEHEGVVLELGALSVKIADYRGNEVTLPNSSVVAGSVINHSRLAEPGGVRAWVRVTIGYDVPWRQVSELLLQAAAVTPGVRSAPAPQVFQRALSDFAVEYEITVEVAGPRLRAQAVSSLHAHIQDVFNTAGVAILSPHFVVSPTPVTAATSGAST
jgi:small-conductance mechanosensitive channel